MAVRRPISDLGSRPNWAVRVMSVRENYFAKLQNGLQRFFRERRNQAKIVNQYVFKRATESCRWVHHVLP
jgi:hypothetical protein